MIDKVWKMVNNVVIFFFVFMVGFVFVYYCLCCYFVGGICKNMVLMKGKIVFIIGVNIGFGKEMVLEFVRC